LLLVYLLKMPKYINNTNIVKRFYCNFAKILWDFAKRLRDFAKRFKGFCTKILGLRRKIKGTSQKDYRCAQCGSGVRGKWGQCGGGG
jgi:hypothetical protein